MKGAFIISIFIMIIALMAINTIAEDIPQDTNTLEIQTIQQEHKNTRKFFSDELSRQREALLQEVDARGDYYEKIAEDFKQNAVWKLSLLWGGVVFFFSGFTFYLNIRLERKRFKRLKEAVLKEVNPKYTSFTDERKKEFEKKDKEAKNVFKKQMDEMDKIVDTYRLGEGLGDDNSVSTNYKFNVGGV